MSWKDTQEMDADGSNRQQELDLFGADSIEFESFTSTTEPFNVDTLIDEFDSLHRPVEPKRFVYSFAELLHALPVPTLLIDQSDRIIFANRSWRKMGGNYENLHGKTFSSLFSNPAVARRVRSVLEDLFDTMKAKVSGAVLEVGRSKIWSRIYIRSMNVGGDKALLVVVEDITAEKKQLRLQEMHGKDLLKARDQLEERVRDRTAELIRTNERLLAEIKQRRLVEERLKASRSGFTSIVEKTGEGIVVFDHEGNILYSNPAAARLLGSYGNQVIKHVRERSPVPGETLELEGWRRDRDERVLEIRVENTDWNGMPAQLAMMRDITNRKRAENDLLKAEKLRSLELIAGGIAHDFNNLLTGILANVSLAKIRADKNSQVYDALKNAEKAASSARTLTQQLLTFTKSEAEPDKRLISVSEILRQCVALVLSGSSIRHEIRIPDDLWGVEADPQQISQVIQNLLINSQQAMPEGGTVTISAENVPPEDEETAGKQEQRQVRIRFEDNGPGMSPDVIPKIFDPYFTTKPRGSGLGLSTAYSIVKKHQGRMEVTSKPGAGTTFIITLPASDSPVESTAEMSGEIPVIGRERILLMDDDDIIRAAASELLELLGYDVVCAKDGAEAVELYKRAIGSARPFSAVIMDLTVPGGMGGKAAIRKLLEIDPDVRAIVSSGYVLDPILSDYKRYGFKGIVPKPYNAQDLTTVLDQVLGRDSD